MAGAAAPWDPSYLEPIDRPAIDGRLLANLRAIYLRGNDFLGLRWVMRLRCALPQATIEDRRDFARLMAPLN